MPKGHFLICQPGIPGMGNSHLKELDEDLNTIWDFYGEIEGKGLDWVHDADYIGNDKFLIADTNNNRVIEIFRNGTVLWIWDAYDHYGDFLTQNGIDGTHLNDVDRLPDSSTMISLSKLDKIVIINTTTGDILWEYGEYQNWAILNHPHNPELTPEGTIIICDSNNNRIVEINKTTKEVIWYYEPTGDYYLGWPRDVDLLPNGNLLICDTSSKLKGHNRIYEINKSTKEVVWYHDTSGHNYDAERLDTLLPEPIVQSPLNQTYPYNTEIIISLDCVDPYVDTIMYRLFDETEDSWLDPTNITYVQEVTRNLLDNHTYTLHVWGLDTYMEGGTAITDRVIKQVAYKTVTFTIKLGSSLVKSPQGYLLQDYINVVIKNYSIISDAAFQYKSISNHSWSIPYQLSWNGSYWVKSMNHLSDAHYIMNFTLIHNSNYIENFISEFIVDTTTPEIINESNSSSEFYFPNNITFECFDENYCKYKITRIIESEGIHEVLYGWSDFLNISAVNFPIINNQEGNIIIAIEIQDIAGNYENSSITFNCIDTINPNLIIVDPCEELYILDLTIQDTYQLPVRLYADDLNSFNVWYKIYDTMNRNFTTFENISYYGPIIERLGIGTYELYAWVEDIRGNRNESVFTFEIQEHVSNDDSNDDIDDTDNPIPEDNGDETNDSQNIIVIFNWIILGELFCIGIILSTRFLIFNKKYKIKRAK